MIIGNCKLIREKEVLENAFIEIEGPRIKNFGPMEELLTDEFIDGKGLYLAAGLIDIHNHGSSGYDFMDASPKALELISKNHLKNGVTSFLGSIITDDLNRMLRATSFLSSYKTPEELPSLEGIYLEGPFFSGKKLGAQNPDYIRAIDLDLMEKFLSIKGEKIKVVSLASELENSLELMDFLKSKGKILALGHSYASYEEAKIATDKGASLASHLFNGMREMNHRELGLAGACLLDNRVYTEIIADGVHLSYETIDLVLRLKGYEKVILISDATRAANMPDGVYELGGQNIYLKDSIARLKNNALAGSTTNLLSCVQGLINNLSIPPRLALNMASINPARALNLDENIGSIEKGKLANLLILNSSMELQKLILRGKLLDIR